MTEPPGGSPRPSPISPDDLLQHARTVALHYPSLTYSGDAPSSEEIARVLAGLPYPSEADFRRAVSASYFALFHASLCAPQRFWRPERLAPSSFEALGRLHTGTSGVSPLQ